MGRPSEADTPDKPGKGYWGREGLTRASPRRGLNDTYSGLDGGSSIDL